jgi:hypothetical protein
MEREIVLHDGNKQQSFAALALKPNGQIKTRVRTNEFHPIQQPPGMKRLVEVAGGAFWNMTLHVDRWGWTSGRSPSWCVLEP